MMFLTVLIIAFIPNCLLSEINDFGGINKFDDNIGSVRTRMSRHSQHVLKFMKKLYKKVHSGRIPLPKDANTVRSVWPIEDSSHHGYLIYNVSSPKTEEVVKAILFIKGHTHSRHPSRILIDVVPTPGTDTPPGINVPLKEVESVDIKQVLVQANKVHSLLTINPQELQMGFWKTFEMKKSPIIVIFSSDSIPASLESLGLKSPVTRETFRAKARRKRELNFIHSNYIFKDLVDETNNDRKKIKLKSIISKRQRYMRKKLNQKKQRKHKKHKKSSKKRKQKNKNGLIPYPKDYPKNSKDNEVRKRKKIIPQTFISASMNRISNEVSSIPKGEVKSTGICELQEIYVDFKDLGWDFVIAPMGFSPNYCTGGCPNPLSRTVAGTNYAIIRSLMRHIGQWRNLSPSYCVAAKMTSLTLLIQTKEEKIELKNYPNIQADSCSCQ